MHLYAFGSLCRGEIDTDSDIDLLAVVSGSNVGVDPEKFSIYSYERLEELWKTGNAFAWHLSLEARLLFAHDDANWIQNLGRPAPYATCLADCLKFLDIYNQAASHITAADAVSQTFELSTIFLAIRNIATCYSLGKHEKPTFSRHAALRLSDLSLSIKPEAYSILERARILSTRGLGASITAEEVESVIGQFGKIGEWVDRLIYHARDHE